MMNVSSWSIKNPIPAILLFLLLTLIGLMGFRAMKIQNFPDVDLPMVIVSAIAVGVFTDLDGVIALATLISALTVSLAGVIGWVGLLVPHIARLITGPGNRLLLPASALLGAIFLLLADGLARNLAETEIPIGIVTELLGTPAFLLVLHRARKGWV